MEISKITTKQDQFDYTHSDQFLAYTKPGHDTAVETGSIKLEQQLKFFAKYKRMIIDEVDFLPLDDEASNRSHVDMRITMGTLVIPYWQTLAASLSFRQDQW